MVGNDTKMIAKISYFNTAKHEKCHNAAQIQQICRPITSFEFEIPAQYIVYKSQTKSICFC